MLICPNNFDLHGLLALSKYIYAIPVVYDASVKI
jgi:hypothetical protein